MRHIPAMLAAAGLASTIGLAARADVMPMKTPSGNIACSVGIGDATDITCSIRTREGAPPLPQPADCPGSWGHVFELLERGTVRMTCGGPWPDNTAPSVAVAEYGQSADFGGITCTSRRTGFTCRNLDAHGFMLSRRSQLVF